MLLTFLASVGLAFYGYYRQLLINRLQAISQVERNSGFVTFRNEQGGIPIDVTEEVRRRDRVEAIYLADSKLEDRTLALLSALNDVQFISFNCSSFADSHVGYLDELKNLQVLQLNGTRVTKAGLEHLAQRHQLKHLALNNTGINDDSLATLIKMKSLQSLYLRDTQISETGMDRLKLELPNCKIKR